MDLKPTNRHSASLDELSIGEVLQLLWSSWKLIVIVAAVSVILGMLFVALSRTKYEATIVLAPAFSQSASAQSAVSSIVSSLPALSALTGGDQDATVESLLTIMSSVSVAERLDRKHDLLKRVFGDQWDEESGTWQRPSSFSLLAKTAFFSLMGMEAWEPPNAFRLSAYFQESIEVARSDDTSLVTVSLKHPDRKFATWLLERLYLESDRIMRLQEIEWTDQKLSYLITRIDKEIRVENRQILTAQFAQLEVLKTELNSGTPYAARLIQGAQADTIPVSPRPVFTTAVFLLLGLLIGPAIAIIRHVWWPGSADQEGT